MRRSPLALAGLVICASALLAAAPEALAAGQLQTAIVAGKPYYGADADLAFARTLDAGATAIRLQVSWRATAPAGSTLPAGFDASNPADPAYHWSTSDQLVQSAVAHGLDPFIGISEAPDWAERGSGGRPGTNNPDPVELGRFAEALARRYGGSFGTLPRVRSFEVWNEANASFFFFPQRKAGRPVSPALYGRMVNEVSAGVRRVHADNHVIAGGLFPFVIDSPNTQAIGPLRFMRELLCLTRKLRPKRRCGRPLDFEIWSHHPYTSGGPTHRAGRNSVSIRELPRMRRLLGAGVRHGRIAHRVPVRLWVTEFSWDSRPPDPNGVPERLHARWVAEALYRMWGAGVSRVTWFQLRDDSADGRPHGSVFQSGLYSRCEAGLGCDRPKRALAAFRFPFVAFRFGRKVRVWGRTPAGRPARVIVEQDAGKRWRRLRTLRANRYGIFSRRLRTSRRGRLRVRLPGGPAAVPFSLVRPPDRRVNPFG